MRKTTKKLLAAALSTAMVVASFTGVGAVNGAKPASAAISSVWKEDGYHAYLYYQTKTWDYRDPDRKEDHTSEGRHIRGRGIKSRRSSGRSAGGNGRSAQLHLQ